MDTVSLDVQQRDIGRKAAELLRSNLIPVEYYGRGIENRSLQVDYQTFRRLLRKAGTNTIIELTVGGSDKVNVLVHEVQKDPISDQIAHVDLIHVRMDEEIHTQIPVELVGIAPAVKDLGGTLMHHLDNLDVRCLPKDLIHKIEVNIESIVDFHSAIRVQDLKISDTITVLNDPTDIVATAVAPRVEEEPEVAEEAEVAEGEEAAEKEGEEKVEESGEKQSS